MTQPKAGRDRNKVRGGGVGGWVGCTMISDETPTAIAFFCLPQAKNSGTSCDAGRNLFVRVG